MGHGNNRFGRAARRLIVAGMAAIMLAGCGTTTVATSDASEVPAEAYVDAAGGFTTIEDEAVALAAGAPALPTDFRASAPGLRTKSNAKATVDYSNAAEGYVMVRYDGPTEKRLKALVKGPTTQYQYNIDPETWVSLPLSDGNGAYTVGVYENTRGNSYSTAVSTAVDVTLADEFAPFLRTNQYVDIASAPATVAKAAELCEGVSDPLEKVGRVYDYVVHNTSYDHQKAATVQSGYLPVLDEVLGTRKGICFDYAALMTGMLRSQGVPCKLVVGYAGSEYHAWIDVFTEGQGWVSGAVWSDGESWKRMDPTFASNANESPDIMAYIGGDQNYSAKYFY